MALKKLSEVAGIFLQHFLFTGAMLETETKSRQTKPTVPPPFLPNFIWNHCKTDSPTSISSQLYLEAVINPFMPTVPFLWCSFCDDSNSTKHYTVLTCSGQFKKGHSIQWLYFWVVSPFLSNKGGSHLQGSVTTFWTPWKATKGKSIKKLSFIFLYQTNKNGDTLIWIHFSGIIQKMSLLVSVGVWTAVPKMGLWAREGFDTYYKRDLLIFCKCNVHQVLSMLADDINFVRVCVWMHAQWHIIF